MRPLLLIAMGFALLPGQAISAPQSDLLVQMAGQCVAVPDDADRLHCFDLVFSPAEAPNDGENVSTNRSTNADCDGFVATLRRENEAPGSATQAELDAATEGYIDCLGV